MTRKRVYRLRSIAMKRRNNAFWASLTLGEGNNAKPKAEVKITSGLAESVLEIVTKEVDLPSTDKSSDVLSHASLQEKADQPVVSASLQEKADQPVVSASLQEKADQPVASTSWADSSSCSRVTRAVAADAAALNSTPQTRSSTHANVKKRRLYYGSSDDGERETQKRKKRRFDSESSDDGEPAPRAYTSRRKGTEKNLSDSSVKKRALSLNSSESALDSESDAPAPALRRARSKLRNKTVVSSAVEAVSRNLPRDEILTVLLGMDIADFNTSHSLDLSTKIAEKQHAAFVKKIIDETLFDYTYESENQLSETIEAPQVEVQPVSHPTVNIEEPQVEIQPVSHPTEISKAPQVEVQSVSLPTETIEEPQIEIPVSHPTETIEEPQVEIQPVNHPIETMEAQSFAQEERREEARRKEQQQKKISSPEKRKQLTNPDDALYENLLPNEPTLLSSLKQVNSLLVQAACPSCLAKSITIRLPEYKKETARVVRMMELYCRRCKKIINKKSTSKKIVLPVIDVKKHKNSPKITDELALRFVLGSTFAGIGYMKMAKFMSYLNLDSISHTQYNAILGHTSAMTVQRLQENKIHIANQIRKRYIESGEQPDEKGMVNIVIVYDGTWMTRGHDSLIGIGAIIEVETGLIIDIIVTSKQCNACDNRKNLSKEEFKIWYKGHQQDCEANYSKELSSGSMESNNAVKLFEGSKKLDLRYASFIGDEDYATYKKLCDSKVYGDFVIKKINCLNHNSKKVYRLLETLRTTERLESQAEGALTQKWDNFLANIYRTASGSFPDDHDKARNMINAAINHSSATDENPSHELCNPTWCKYQKECKEGNTPGPGWHRDKSKRKYWITEKVAGHVRSLFEKLTQDSVLDRITGQTQNASESLHSKLWNVLPKAGYRGFTHVDQCVAQVVLDHNLGLEAASMLSAYGLPLGNCLKRMHNKIEKSRQRVKTKTKFAKKKEEPLHLQGTKKEPLQGKVRITLQEAIRQKTFNNNSL